MTTSTVAPAYVAAYVRVSSRAQTHATQRHAIERAAHVRDEQVAEWYAETLSGKSLDRPELQRLLTDVRAGKVRRLYVYRLDRLTRSGIRDTLDVVETIRGAGCQLVTIADGFDPSGPAAQLILAVMAWAAEMERVTINERISAARERIAEEGGTWGRPPRMTTDQRQEAVRRALAGSTVREIAAALKIPRPTVQRALKAGGVVYVGRGGHKRVSLSRSMAQKGGAAEPSGRPS